MNAVGHSQLSHYSKMVVSTEMINLISALVWYYFYAVKLQVHASDF